MDASEYREPFYGDWNEYDPDAPPDHEGSPEARKRWARQRDGQA